MKLSAEYSLAEQLIAHLQQVEELAPGVLGAPFDTADQCQLLAMAAMQHEFAIAVKPMPPQAPADRQDRTGVLACRLAVLVFTTAQVVSGSAAAFASAVTGQVLAACMAWTPQGNGIPYAEPSLDSVAELDTSDLPGLDNLVGYTVMLSKNINLKQYYK